MNSWYVSVWAERCEIVKTNVGMTNGRVVDGGLSDLFAPEMFFTYPVFNDMRQALIYI